MRLVNREIKYLILIAIIAIIFVFDLFINVGRSANGDGLIHTVVPALFAHSITQGIVPVGWVDGFANYGLPLGTVSQQVTTYATACITIFSHNPTVGFNIVTFLGVLLSCVFFYFFLRIYFSPIYAFVGVYLFNFEPYRILTIYSRGALPEFFAEVFFPLLLIGAYLTIMKKNIYGVFLFTISLALLTLTHPFMDIVACFLLVPYIGYLFYSSHALSFSYMHTILRYGLLLIGMSMLGLLSSSYYMLPLLFEIKYFYYGLSANHLTPNNYLSLPNFLFYSYPYFTPLDIFNRGFKVNVGGLEFLLLLSGTAYSLYLLFHKRNTIVFFTLSVAISGWILLFMTTELASPLYAHIKLLSNIQFPWRMLSAFIFIPPILLSFILSKIENKLLIFLCICCISFLAFPQLYGKNYTVYPATFYSFTPYNLDAVVMNTIWTGNSEKYPITSEKYEIIAGKGSIAVKKITENERIYDTSSVTPIRVADHTFYFPGWKAYIDGNETSIQYQDPNYRGVITYLVPAGNHTVTLRYTDTKIRLLGKVLTVFSTLVLVILFLQRKRLQKLLI